MTEQERRAELRKLAEAATQAKANGDTWMAVHPDTLTVLVAEIAALKEKVKRQAEALAPFAAVGAYCFDARIMVESTWLQLGLQAKLVEAAGALTYGHFRRAMLAAAPGVKE